MVKNIFNLSLLSLEKKKMLYHYTTIDKLKSILETQQLWLTKISNLEDVSEFFYTISLVCDELSLSSENRYRLYNEITKTSNYIFVGSFCGDVDSLYLWKHYGEFNIEFSKIELMYLVDYQQRTMGYILSHSGLLPCEYHRWRHEKITIDALEQWIKGNNYSIPVNDLTHLATIFKKSEFCTEQETRLVLYLKIDSPIKTFDSNQKKFNYWELPFRTDSARKLIKSITIGPIINPDDVERELRVFLNKHQLGYIAINRSKISNDEFMDSKPLNQMICQNCEWFAPASQVEVDRI